MPKVKHRQWVLTLHNSQWVRHKQSVNPSLLSSGWLPDGEENVSERGHEREAEKTGTGSEVERSGIYFYTVSHLKIVLINRPVRFFSPRILQCHWNTPQQILWFPRWDCGLVWCPLQQVAPWVTTLVANAYILPFSFYVWPLSFFNKQPFVYFEQQIIFEKKSVNFSRSSFVGLNPSVYTWFIRSFLFQSPLQ